nr:CMRF35-like molecule 9 isoform X1 [Pogona vitticeps]
MRLLGTLSLLGWVITPGCWGLYCPDEVHPSVGGSLSVSCQYKQGLEKYSKFWCKETARIYCSALVKSQSDGKGIKQRISIRDNKEKQYFEVIMRNLTKEDSGVYRCGIDDSLLLFRDSTCRIHVAVSPAPTLDPEEEQTTSKPTEKLQTTKRHKKLAPTEPPDSDSFTEGTSESSSFSASTRIMFPTQKRSNPISHGKASTRDTEDPHNEDTLHDHSSDADGTGLYQIVAIHPENNCDAMYFQEEPVEKRDEVSYTTLLHSDLQPQAIYGNIDHLSCAVIQPLTQEVVYAEVTKKHGN